MSGVNKGINDISTVFPHLIKEWDYEKNGNLTPDSVSAHSNKKMWWKCDKGHSFCSSPDHRSRGQNCPFCSGKQVLAGFNDLATTMPSMAKEWDYEKNTEYNPTTITAGSQKKVWWKCQQCGQLLSGIPDKTCKQCTCVHPPVRKLVGNTFPIPEFLRFHLRAICGNAANKKTGDSGFLPVPV